jgi:hypothetical protein
VYDVLTKDKRGTFKNLSKERNIPHDERVWNPFTND